MQRVFAVDLLPWASMVGKRAAARSIALAAALLTSTEVARAFCRSTTVVVPPSFSPVQNGCFLSGFFLYWRSGCVGYTIFRQASSSVPYDEAARVIDASFAASACIRFKI